MQHKRNLFSSDLTGLPLNEAFIVIPINQQNNNHTIGTGISNEKHDILLKDQLKFRLVLKDKQKPLINLPYKSRGDIDLLNTDFRKRNNNQLPQVEEERVYSNTKNQFYPKNSKSILKKQKTLTGNGNANSNGNSNSPKKQYQHKIVRFGSAETPLAQVIHIEPRKRFQEDVDNQKNNVKCQCSIY